MKKKQTVQKYLPRQKAEELVRKHVAAIRKIRGFVNITFKTTIRVSDSTLGPDTAAVIQGLFS